MVLFVSEVIGPDLADVALKVRGEAIEDAGCHICDGKSTMLRTIHSLGKDISH